MWFSAIGLEKALQRADLVDDAVGEFVPADLHLAPAEALEIGERGVRPHLHAMLFRKLHGGAHVVEVRGVEAAGHVCHVDQRHQAGIVAHLVEAERLAHVTNTRRLCALLFRSVR
jgi:hypothetical protein